MAQTAGLLIVQTRPATVSFLDLDLSPSLGEKAFISLNKLSIKVTPSGDCMDYKTRKALPSFVPLP